MWWIEFTKFVTNSQELRQRIDQAEGIYNQIVLTDPSAVSYTQKAPSEIISLRSPMNVRYLEP